MFINTTNHCTFIVEIDRPNVFILMMKLNFLGTASCFPTPIRGVSCTALLLDEGQIWLFDCGEGSQIQLQKCKNLRPGKVTKIFITHLHGDHLFGLPGLLCTLGNGSDPNNDRIVDIYGPTGLRKYLITSLELSRSVPSLKFNIIELHPLDSQFPEDFMEWNTDFEYIGNAADKVGEVNYTKISATKIGAPKTSVSTNSLNHEASNSKDCCNIDPFESYIWDLFGFNGSNYSVKAGILKHRIPSFGYVVTEKDKPGKLNAFDLQRDYNLKPGPLFGQIKQGKVIDLEDGRKINSDDYLDPPITGRKVAIFGDTCDSHGMDLLTRNSDVLVHEATMENSLTNKAIEYGHSTPEMAAKFAFSTNAKKLCITHVSPRYRPLSDLKAGKNDETSQENTITVDILKTEAETYLESVESPIDVVVAEDFLILPVPRVY